MSPNAMAAAKTSVSVFGPFFQARIGRPYAVAASISNIAPAAVSRETASSRLTAGQGLGDGSALL